MVLERHGVIGLDSSVLAQLQSRILSYDPILAYMLQEESGATTLASFGSVNAPLTISGATPGQPGPFSGKLAVSFDNVNDFAATTVAGVAPTTCSFMAIYKRTSTNDANHILFHVGQENGTPGMAGGLLNLSAGANVNKPRFAINTNASKEIIAASAVDNTGWHVLTGTYDLSNLNLYNDSITETPVAETNAIDWTTTRLEVVIGALEDNGGKILPYGGFIALCALIGRAITQSEHDAVRVVLGI